jgi:hypothetical protein
VAPACPLPMQIGCARLSGRPGSGEARGRASQPMNCAAGIRCVASRWAAIRSGFEFESLVAEPGVVVVERERERYVRCERGTLDGYPRTRTRLGLSIGALPYLRCGGRPTLHDRCLVVSWHGSSSRPRICHPSRSARCHPSRSARRESRDRPGSRAAGSDRGGRSRPRLSQTAGDTEPSSSHASDPLAVTESRTVGRLAALASGAGSGSSSPARSINGLCRRPGVRGNRLRGG